MPYVKMFEREKWDSAINDVQKVFLENDIYPGDLNYLISRIIAIYVRQKGKNYNILNEVKGVLSCVSDEFTRRVINPYEDEKIKENGDL